MIQHWKSLKGSVKMKLLNSHLEKLVLCMLCIQIKVRLVKCNFYRDRNVQLKWCCMLKNTTANRESWWSETSIESEICNCCDVTCCTQAFWHLPTCQKFNVPTCHVFLILLGIFFTASVDLMIYLNFHSLGL